MVKNKKVIKRETESDTDTDTENDKKILNSKDDKAKRNKMYMILGVVLLAVVAFIWYRRRGKTQVVDNSQMAPTQIVQQRSTMSGMQQMPASMPQIAPMQMGGMQQRLNPIQKIQLTQQMH